MAHHPCPPIWEGSPWLPTNGKVRIRSSTVNCMSRTRSSVLLKLYAQCMAQLLAHQQCPINIVQGCVSQFSVMVTEYLRKSVFKEEWCIWAPGFGDFSPWSHDSVAWALLGAANHGSGRGKITAWRLEEEEAAVTISLPRTFPQ